MQQKKCLLFLFLITFVFSLPAIAEYVDNSDGTITDTNTGLMWQKYGNGYAVSYQSAEIYVESLNWGIYSDWRLPNANELKDIKEYIISLPTFDGNEGYWTNQVDPLGGPSCVCFIDHGTSVEVLLAWCTTARVLAVREPQEEPGDCNGDGAVSIDEIQKSINCYLSLENACCDKCDLNSDGTVSINEVQKVINAYLGK